MTLVSILPFLRYKFTSEKFFIAAFLTLTGNTHFRIKSLLYMYFVILHRLITDLVGFQHFILHTLIICDLRLASVTLQIKQSVFFIFRPTHVKKPYTVSATKSITITANGITSTSKFEAISLKLMQPDTQAQKAPP